MATLPIIYSRSRTIGGILIRAASWWDQWNHCGVITPEDTVLEARAFDGVIETPMSEFLQRYTQTQTVTVEVLDPAAGIAWGRSQLGAEYDYGAILEFVLRNPYNDKTKYHCAEYVENIITFAGRNRFRRLPHKVTVQQSFMVR